MNCLLCSYVVFILQAYAAAGTIKENYANILVLLLRLRQACDHPLLLKGSHSNLEMAKQLSKETLIDLLEKLEGDPAICSICSVSILVTQICYLVLEYFLYEEANKRNLNKRYTCD